MLGIKIDGKRIFGLDVLRAFAIICVVHGHAVCLLANTRLSFLSEIPHPRGVDIFFILSGYLIGGSFLSYAQKNQKVDFRKSLHFYARTSFRILPNYYFILLAYIFLISFGLVNGDIHRFPLWMFCTFTQNLFTPFYDFYWESWSLSVQWWFYLLFPILLTITSIRINPRKITPFICLFFIVFSIA
ncbi:MAG: acyltransferase [Bacteroidales bacterium]|nr:acyltransferase [Bacteroidales bacterium]